MNYFNNINLNQNELQKAVMHPLEQPPATAKQGQMYFNTVDKKLYYYNNTEWVALNDIDLSNYVTTTQLNDGLNKKLDKQTTDASKTQVYAVTGSTQKMIDATSAATENTVVLRDANGRFQAVAGDADNDVVNKGQMDTAIAAAQPYHITVENYTGTVTQEQYDKLKADNNSYVYIKKADAIATKVINWTTGLYYNAAVGVRQYKIYIQADLEYSVDEIDLERTNNKVTEITGTGNDIQYPSTSAVAKYVKVKDVTLDGTSIVNAEGIVPLESTPYIELSGTNGSIDAEQYKNLSGDKQSYIILTYTGYPYRLPYVANDGGGLIYSTIIRPRANSRTSLSKLTVYINGSQLTWGASETPVVTSAGGTIDGSVTIDGNLTVKGTTTTVESETLKVKDQLIEVASGNTAKLSSPAGLVVPKYDGTNNGALVFDNTGTAYVGDVVLDSNGLIDTTAAGTKLVALAGRAKTIAGDNLVKWDDTNQIFVDTGIAASDILTNGNFTDYISTTKTEPQAIKSSLQLGSDTQNCAFISNTGSYRLLKKGVITEYNADNIVHGSSTLTLPSKAGTIALLSDIPSSPTNMVTTDGNQNITGVKTFDANVILNSTLQAGTSVGTAGQVLTSQGDGKAPIWQTVSDVLPDNVVTTDTPQQITSAKTFSATTEFTNAIKVSGVVGTAGQVMVSQGADKSPVWTTLTIPQGTVKKFVEGFTGNNTDLEFSFEHKLGTDQCTVSLYKLNDSNNYEMVMADIILTTTNVIVKFAQAPATTDSFRVVVTG